MKRTILRLIAAIAISVTATFGVAACGTAAEDDTEQEDDD